MNAFSPSPEFYGKAGNFASDRQEVELRMSVAQLPSNRPAPALALAMDKMPRELCLAFGVAVLKPDAGVGETMETSRYHFAPDASGAARRDVIPVFGIASV